MTAPLRLTVLGETDLVVDLDPSDRDPDDFGDFGDSDDSGDSGDSGEPSGPAAPEVRALRPSPEERAAGQALCEVTVDGWVFQVRSESAARAALRDRARRGAAASRTHVRELVRARIPGRVVRLWVEPGQSVEAGERLLAVEAMKMENEVRAPRAGVVVSIAVEPGQPVELGTELLTLD